MPSGEEPIIVIVGIEGLTVKVTELKALVQEFPAVEFPLLFVRSNSVDWTSFRLHRTGVIGFIPKTLWPKVDLGFWKISNAVHPTKGSTISV